MKHHIKGRKFNIKGSHRKSLFKNLIISLVKYNIITTTISKAKELRTVIEPIINLAKNNNIYNKRLIFYYLRNKYIVNKLFILGKLFLSKNGGYTRIIRKGWRKGDNALLVYILFSDIYN